MALMDKIIRLVEKNILNGDPEVHLTLLLRNVQRLSDLTNNPQVTLVEGDANNEEALKAAIHAQDIVYVSFVEHGAGAKLTQKIIKVMKDEGVHRLISSNILGIYDEVPGAFGDFNRKMCFGGHIDDNSPVVLSDRYVEESGLDYTVLRIAWLNDRNDTNYTITHKGEEYVGVSVSRKSVAEVVTKIIENPNKWNNESIGFADPTTQGSSRPVY
ncbi:NAD(P)H-binding protein [Limosilactobacillus sp. Sa3CUN2]|uniref:NAD(P)H-binding protein n=1 Tax=Limosilactobacillus avistercoris TaxID=2762243 RepID=A0ABR8PBL4_9LACO|nr:NAD(P)H-binding protein [Limosilactobacillus avistercoris]